MGIEQAVAKPPRCFAGQRDHGRVAWTACFNPTQLAEKVQVNWNRLQVPGLSHQVLQFQGTGNRQFSAVEFYLDKVFAAEQPGDTDIMEFRRFLRVPHRAAGGDRGVPATAPPRVLFIWPGVLVGRDGAHRRRVPVPAVRGRRRRCWSTPPRCTFEEILDARVTSEYLRQEEY
ncbi:MAG: hypothetical protein MZV63_31810 [Marinilabiliales bacterium]|nr:hypothetical protein [Marinilabiliales bacterium]